MNLILARKFVYDMRRRLGYECGRLDHWGEADHINTRIYHVRGPITHLIGL